MQMFITEVTAVSNWGFGCIRNTDAKEYRLPPRRGHTEEDGRAVYPLFQSHELKFGPRGTYFQQHPAAAGAPGQDRRNPG